MNRSTVVVVLVIFLLGILAGLALREVSRLGDRRRRRGRDRGDHRPHRVLLPDSTPPAREEGNQGDDDEAPHLIRHPGAKPGAATSGRTRLHAPRAHGCGQEVLPGPAADRPGPGSGSPSRARGRPCPGFGPEGSAGACRWPAGTAHQVGHRVRAAPTSGTRPAGVPRASSTRRAPPRRRRPAGNGSGRDQHHRQLGHLRHGLEGQLMELGYAKSSTAGPSRRRSARPGTSPRSSRTSRGRCCRPSEPCRPRRPICTRCTPRRVTPPAPGAPPCHRRPCCCPRCTMISALSARGLDPSPLARSPVTNSMPSPPSWPCRLTTPDVVPQVPQPRRPVAPGCRYHRSRGWVTSRLLPLGVPAGHP